MNRSRRAVRLVRIRVGLALVMILSPIYIAVALIASVINSSLTNVVAGLAVWATAALGYLVSGRSVR